MFNSILEAAASHEVDSLTNPDNLALVVEEFNDYQLSVDLLEGTMLAVSPIFYNLDEEYVENLDLRQDLNEDAVAFSESENVSFNEADYSYAVDDDDTDEDDDGVDDDDEYDDDEDDDDEALYDDDDLLTEAKTVAKTKITDKELEDALEDNDDEDLSESGAINFSLED